MPSRNAHENSPTLTRREREILELFAQGFRDKETADALHTSELAVKENQIGLMRKLNVEDMSSAIEYALLNELISVYEILESRYSKTRLKTSTPYLQ